MVCKGVYSLEQQQLLEMLIKLQEKHFRLLLVGQPQVVDQDWQASQLN